MSNVKTMGLSQVSIEKTNVESPNLSFESCKGANYDIAACRCFRRDPRKPERKGERGETRGLAGRMVGETGVYGLYTGEKITSPTHTYKTPPQHREIQE
jgi:hypothetical protein